MFNRLVVFSTSEHSNHGQRVPNTCPPGVTRKVLNLYYYTTHRDDEDASADPHFTLYKTEASPFAMQLGADYRACSRARRRELRVEDPRPLTAVDAVVGPRPGNIPVAGPVDHRARGRGRRRRRSTLVVRGCDRSRAEAFEAEFAAAVGRRHAIALPSCTSGLAPGSHGPRRRTRRRSRGSRVDLDRDRCPDPLCRRRRRSSSTSNPTRGAHRSSRSAPCSHPGRRRSSSSTSTAGSPTSSRSKRSPAEHGIAIVEDAAEAAGGWHAGRAAGSFGRLSTFSFHGIEDADDRRGRHGAVRRRRTLYERMLLPARPRPASWRHVVPQRRDRVEVQDERAAGSARPSAARPHRGADRQEARDLRLVRGPARRPADSGSTSSAPTSGQRSGW